MGIPAISQGPSLAPGTRVEVRSRFRRDWVRGFEVAAPDGDGYLLRRISDKSVLPVVFVEDDVRATSGPAWRLTKPSRRR
jgi:hypothetical protein